VLFVDVDRFKSVNDSLGHDGGDLLLIELARRLSEAVRPGDLVARYAGDEFAILLTGSVGDHDAPVGVARRLLDVLQRPVRVRDRDVLVGVSIGIVDPGTVDTQDPEEVVHLADLAMYRAKSTGGARYASYRAHMDLGSGDALDLESGLRAAVAAGQFVLHYQPRVMTERGEVRSAEALLRWERPGVGLVPPGGFIDTAEHTGLIVPIGRWVLGQACRQAAQWHRARPQAEPLVMSVNVSARQLTAPSLVDDVVDALASSGLAPE
jgi:diguanylate cyclase (GGDEF)-like protein